MAAAPVRTWILVCVLFTLAPALERAGCAEYEAQEGTSSLDEQSKAVARRGSPSVAVVNGVPFHTEVYVALLWSLVQANADVSAYVMAQHTQGVEHIIKHWCLPAKLLCQRAVS